MSNLVTPLKNKQCKLGSRTNCFICRNSAFSGAKHNTHLTVQSTEVWRAQKTKYCWIHLEQEGKFVEAEVQ